MDEITDKSIDEGWFDIARPGKWHGSQGGQEAEIQVSREDLIQMAADYSPAIQEAPVTIDHEHWGPAHGWIDELRMTGEVLQARLKQVSTELRQALLSGKYRSRSVEIYKPHTSTGGAYLGALSFLGAKPPAVKGLRPAPQLFTEGAVNSLAWREPGETTEPVTEEGNTMGMDEKQVVELAEKTVKKSVGEALKEMFGLGAREPAVELAETRASLSEAQGQVRTLGEKLAAETARADAAVLKLAEYDKAQELAEFKAGVDKAKAESRITPAEAETFVSLGEKLDGAGRTLLLSQLAERKNNRLLTEHGAPGAAVGNAGPVKFAEQRAFAEGRLKTVPDDKSATETLAICAFGESRAEIKTFAEAMTAYARSQAKS